MKQTLLVLCFETPQFASFFSTIANLRAISASTQTVKFCFVKDLEKPVFIFLNFASNSRNNRNQRIQ